MTAAPPSFPPNGMAGGLRVSGERSGAAKVPPSVVRET